MRVHSPMVALLGALVLASTAVAADLEVGKQVYARKCAACHGPDGQGNTKMAETLKVKIPPLANSATKPDAELRKTVAEGKKPMPPFGKSLSKSELDAVVAYVKGLATGKAAAGK